MIRSAALINFYQNFKLRTRGGVQIHTDFRVY